MGGVRRRALGEQPGGQGAGDLALYSLLQLPFPPYGFGNGGQERWPGPPGLRWSGCQGYGFAPRSI